MAQTAQKISSVPWSMDEIRFRMCGAIVYEISRLVAYGKQLKESGIAFYDFSLIFKDIPEDIYEDDCCHFGLLGNAILAKQLAELIHTDFKQLLENLR
jgi:hypothetical protein